MASKTAVRIDISVYKNTYTGEFAEDDSLEVIEDGFDHLGNERPRRMVELTLVQALNELREENLRLAERIAELERVPYTQP
jgi:hypothetical protein